MKKALLKLLDEFHKDFYEYKAQLPYPHENASPSLAYLYDWLKNNGRFSFMDNRGEPDAF